MHHLLSHLLRGNLSTPYQRASSLYKRYMNSSRKKMIKSRATAVEREAVRRHLSQNSMIVPTVIFEVLQHLQ